MNPFFVFLYPTGYHKSLLTIKAYDKLKFYKFFTYSVGNILPNKMLDTESERYKVILSSYIYYFALFRVKWNEYVVD